jgi:hypothetical protein
MMSHQELSMTNSDTTGNRIHMTRLTRRRFSQGLAATPFALGAATRGFRPSYAQDKVKLVVVTHWGSAEQKDPLE